MFLEEQDDWIRRATALLWGLEHAAFCAAKDHYRELGLLLMAAGGMSLKSDNLTMEQFNKIAMLRYIARNKDKPLEVWKSSRPPLWVMQDISGPTELHGIVEGSAKERKHAKDWR